MIEVLWYSAGGIGLLVNLREGCCESLSSRFHQQHRTSNPIHYIRVI